jgi:acetoacetyl-CoA synthetase
MSNPEPLWRPSSEVAANSFIAKLMARHGFSSFQELHRWSITEIADFWSGVWDDAEIIGDKGSEFYRAGTDFISSEFFLDARLNTGENILARASSAPADEVAIVSLQENGARKTLTWRELYQEVSRVITALKAEGVNPGDRVVAWTPNLTEVLIYGIAGLSIGAIVSTSSPDFAPSAVLDRFGQIEPKILLAADGYSYGGKNFDCMERLHEIEASLPTLTRIVVIPTTSETLNFEPTSKYRGWNEWLSQYSPSEITFEKFSFNHPGFILFSSGTTGKPKCITHSAAGILLKLAVEHRYHFDITPKDRTLFFTTCGWMMWNWILYLLAAGSSIIIYEGSPLYPGLDRLFEIASQERATIFGLSAKLIDSAKKEGLSPIAKFDYSSLRTVVSTGSVLSPEGFEYIYTDLKKETHLVSMSGGTDICGCFLIGVPTLPVYRGELQGECLGMATDVFDEAGKPAATDEKGELVCTEPFPSKPLGFWGDSNHEKYRSAYYEGFPGVWTHGDFASKSARGGYTLYGRSDATLNSKGVRIGTAEIYRVVETFPPVIEAMAVSQDWENDTRVVLFLVMKEELTDELKREIKDALRRQASPRHVPDLIIAAPELPRTKSNKLVELAVTDIINGRTVRNRDALANAAALDWFASCEELTR